jgi:signal peptidase
MSDREDGNRRDGPSHPPAEEDPFEYPSDGSAGEAPGSGGRDRGHGNDPARRRAADPGADAPRGLFGWLKWFWTTDRGAAVYLRDVITSVATVLLVGLLLFAVSGIWPPMVAVESGSMEPNMNVGDLVFVVDNERFVPGHAVEHDGRTSGVVPADRAREVGHTEFNRYGDVIVYQPNGQGHRTPVIHRAMLFVEADENWYDRADRDHVGNADDCEELNNCPAPHAGFITLGDNNARYDQQTTLSAPVRPGWIIGTAEVKVPYLGYVRLAFSGQGAARHGPAMVAPASPGKGTAMVSPSPSPNADAGPVAPAA